ncbi:DUF2179 domain-containing protein [Desulfallas thermosapovorans]|uniref:UPF0316 protein LX24_00067 n=1 Tax=Desulfallas thermosapovorans DSM 6562 TaxID=1121431 RepID=A0A5S4ZXI0_9FIRM|nr:DUF5698 domain-containing protein [Desulfallas thermosapovorans]TYO97784.1 uncharacterized protein YebE (UPF0316 family) [Desulfallas thermosapovorans DSM 6562]
MEQWLPIIYGYLFIFTARVIDMSLDVIRILMLMRDRRVLAAVIGFFEVSVFVLALNEVLKGGLDDPGKVIAYAGGFATGNYIGSLIEERLAMGFLSIQLYPPHSLVNEVVNQMRQAGFGVTSVTGCGRDGERIILFVLIKRKDFNKALNIIDQICPDMFFNVSDAKRIHGGVFPIKKGK